MSSSLDMSLDDISKAVSHPHIAARSHEAARRGGGDDSTSGAEEQSRRQGDAWMQCGRCLEYDCICSSRAASLSMLCRGAPVGRFLLRRSSDIHRCAHCLFVLSLLFHLFVFLKRGSSSRGGRGGARGGRGGGSSGAQQSGSAGPVRNKQRHSGSSGAGGFSSRQHPQPYARVRDPPLLTRTSAIFTSPFDR